MEAIYNLGSDAAGIIPDSTMIEFIESMKRPALGFMKRLQDTVMNRWSKAILGQTLSSDSEEVLMHRVKCITKSSTI